MADDLFFKILKGKFDNIPKSRSRVVRLFLSSTFTDTHAERDYLIESIYPLLKKYCKQKYGLEFQVLDMRWGISNEASTNNHNAATICMNEIQNTQRISNGPNFVALLSHRYGFRDLPVVVDADEFELLKQEIVSNEGIDLSYSYTASDICEIIKEDILDYCYQLDENQVPYCYRLRNINKLIPNYVQNNPDFTSAWEKLQDKLSTLLRSSSDSCCKKGLLTEDQRSKYFVSVTEKEITNGILHANNAESNAVVFIREIENFDANVNLINENPRLASRFIDLDVDHNIDEDARALLDDLKYNKVTRSLPESNIHKFKVKWDSEHGISRATHLSYLEEFGIKFYDSVKLLIDRNALTPHFLDNFELKDKLLLQEVLEHANFCNESVDKFHGRNELIERLKEYIESDSRQPFIVHGESGCGKTSVLAKFSNEILKTVIEPDKYVIIIRFLGTTAGTSNISTVFHSIIFQLARIFSLTQPVDTRCLNTKIDLRDHLYKQLFTISKLYPDKKVIILLDSIDQLSTADYNIEWIIMELPVNIKMIYSTLPHHGGILDHIKSFEVLGENDFVEVKSLTKEMVKEIINDWLAKNKRLISASQWTSLDTVFERAKSLFPLYVKLIFDIIVKWPSYYEPTDQFMKCICIDDSIKYLFEVFEKNHGKMLFSRCVFYLSTFRNGISESELEDVLSIDDDVLYEIFEYHLPPVRRFPAALWARIKHDLNEYVVEKEVDETKVIYWYHRRFIEVANSFYISKLNSAERENVFSNVIDFFNETWKDKPKPFKYNERIAKKNNLKSDDAQASRNTATQPTEFVSDDGQIRYNKRKLNELPAFMAQLTSNFCLPLSCKHVYFKYEFVHGLYTCVNYTDIMENLQKISQNSSYSLGDEAKKALAEIKFLNYLNLQCAISMNDYPDSTAVQILSRTLIFNGFSPYLSEFIKQSDEQSAKHCALIAAYQSLPPPGVGPLFSLEKHTEGIMCAVIGGENSGYVFTLSNKIHAFNMSSVKTHGELDLPKLTHQSDKYKHMLVYFAFNITDDSDSLKLMNGNVVVISDHQMHSINFDTNVNFSKTFDFQKISKIMAISSNHFLVTLEYSKYFEVFNSHTGESVLKRDFEIEIKFIEINMVSEKVSIPNMFAGGVTIVVVLKNSEIHFFKLTGKLDSDDKKSNDVKLEPILRLPASGIGCSGCVTMAEKDKDGSSTETAKFCLSFKDGSYALVSVGDEVQPNFIKPIGTHLNFLLLDYQKTELFLFLSDDHYLYYTRSTETLFKVAGTYNNGRIIHSNLIFGMSKGLIDFYQISPPSDNPLLMKSVLLMQVDAHFMDITRVFLKDTMFLTTSKDCILKVFHLSSIKAASEVNFKLDRTLNETMRTFEVSSRHFGSYATNSPLLYIWDVSNGKIVASIDTGFNAVHDVEYKNGVCGVIGLSSGHYYFKSLGFSVDNEAASYEAGSRVLIDHCIQAGFLASSICSSFVVLNKGIDRIKLDFFDCSDTQWSHTVNDSCKVTASDFGNNLANAALSSDGEVLLLFSKNELCFIDSRKGVLLARKNFSNQPLNYLVPSQRLSDGQVRTFHPIESTRDFVSLNSSKQLVRINFLKDTKSVLVDVNTKLEVEFSRIEVAKHLLLAYSEQMSELYVFNLQASLNTEPLLKLDFLTSSLHFACISADCAYIATMNFPKLVSLFRLETGKRIAHVPLHNDIYCISMSDQFLVMGMHDRRLLAFLVVDTLKPEQQNRIQALDSRNVEKSLTKKQRRMNNLIIAQISSALDESSDEDPDQDNEIFSASLEAEMHDEDENESDDLNEVRKKSRKKFKKNVKALEKFSLNAIPMPELPSEPNWLLDLYMKQSLITSEEAEILRYRQSIVLESEEANVQAKVRTLCCFKYQ